MSNDKDSNLPESRAQRFYKAWHMPISDEPDPPRQPMSTGEKVGLCVAASACLAWGAWLALALRAWLKTL